MEYTYKLLRRCNGLRFSATMLGTDKPYEE